jgi:ubiquinone/menaquinone biosynthesis C-methylase UbiE
MLSSRTATDRPGRRSAQPRAVARRSGARKHPAELIAGDCAQITLPDASVDIVFCHQTFHHLVEQERALAEFWRVLKPGGCCCLPNPPRHTSTAG